jgi:hypothetical protein
MAPGPAAPAALPQEVAEFDPQGLIDAPQILPRQIDRFNLPVQEGIPHS